MHGVSEVMIANETVHSCFQALLENYQTAQKAIRLLQYGEAKRASEEEAQTIIFYEVKREVVRAALKVGRSEFLDLLVDHCEEGCQELNQEDEEGLWILLDRISDAQEIAFLAEASHQAWVEEVQQERLQEQLVRVGRKLQEVRDIRRTT